MSAPSKVGENVDFNGERGELLSDWNEMMARTIGNNKLRKEPYEPPTGIPQAPLLPMEVTLKKVFDSCSFKTGMSGVLGTYT